MSTKNHKESCKMLERGVIVENDGIMGKDCRKNAGKRHVKCWREV